MDGLLAPPSAQLPPTASAAEDGVQPEAKIETTRGPGESGVEGREEKQETGSQSQEEVTKEAGEEDPQLQRFYKMLRVGVPLPAVRIKMASEGLDPDLLKG